MPAASERSATEQGSASPTAVSNDEAYAIARIVDHDDAQPLVVGDTYVLEAGVGYHIPREFKGAPFTLPTVEEEMEFEINVYAKGMDVFAHGTDSDPARTAFLKFRRGEESALLRFFLIPTAPGPTSIEVEFYYRRHWLAQVAFHVEIVAARTLAAS
jgi:hypothetical protein